MAFKIEIDTVDQTDNIDLLQDNKISLGPLNERSEATFTCKPGYTPDRLLELIAYKQDGTTKLWGGVILNRSFEGLIQGSNPGRCTLECVDWFFYTDVCSTNLTYGSSQTLKAILDDLVDEVLDTFGFTLDASQVDGPTLNAFTWSDLRVSDALRQLSDATGYVVRINADKELSMILPGSTAAPYAMTDGAPHAEFVSWNDPDKVPANKVVLWCGPDGFGDPIQEQWTVVGAEVIFDVGDPGPPSAPVFPGYVNIDGVDTPIWLASDTYPADAITWDYATANGRLEFHGSSSGLLSPGTVLTFVRIPQFPFMVSADSGDTPVIEVKRARIDILDPDVAQTVAEGLLAQVDQSPRQLQVVSLDEGWEPGQELSVTLTHRVTGTFSITNVEIQLKYNALWIYMFEATETDVYQGSELQQWRDILGGSSSLVATTGGAAIGAFVIPPFSLGGARQRAVTMAASPDWLPVLDYLSYFPAVSFEGKVRATVRARNTSVDVQLRLRNVTDSTSVLSSVVTDTAATDITFNVTITLGKEYRLEILGEASEDVYGIGTLESR